MNKPTLEQLHSVVQAPRRATFKAELRSALVAETEPVEFKPRMHFKKVLTWLTVPALAVGIAAVVVVLQKPVAQLLPVKQVVADSIAQFYGDTSDAIVHYGRMEVLNANNEVDLRSEMWWTLRENIAFTHGVDDRWYGSLVNVKNVDTTQYCYYDSVFAVEDNAHPCTESTIPSIFSSAVPTVELSNPVLVREADSVYGEALYATFKTAQPLPSFTLQSISGETSVAGPVFKQGLSFGGYFSPDNAEFDESARTLNMVQADGTYLQKILLNGGSEGYIPVTAKDIYVQITVDEAVSAVYDLSVDTGEATTLSSDAIQHLVDSYVAFDTEQYVNENVSKVTEGLQNKSDLQFAEQNGELVDSADVMVNGQSLLWVKYTVPTAPNTGVDGYEFWIDRTTSAVKEVHVFVEGKMNSGYRIIELTKLSNLKPDAFFTEANFKDLLKERNLQ